MMDINKRTLVKHYYIHGCDAKEIRDRAEIPLIYVKHAIERICQVDPAAEQQHWTNKCHGGPFHFATSHIVTGSDAYREGV